MNNQEYKLVKSEAVFVVIKDEQGRFLMGKRSTHKLVAPGYWVPISGTIEPCENEMETVVRECLEEIGTIVEPIEKITEMISSDGTCLLHWWTARIISGEPHITTHELSELRWVTMEELKKLTPTFEKHILLLENISKDSHN